MERGGTNIIDSNRWNPERIPRCGSLLVAEPFLREQYFHHAVICLVDYEPRGSAMGVVLNNLTSYTLQDLVSSVKVKTPLAIRGDFDVLLSIINDGYDTEGSVRFFIGYSGWSPGQLDEELLKKVWAVTDIRDSHSLLKGAEDSYWHRVVRSMGPEFRGWLYHPRNPHSN